MKEEMTNEHGYVIRYRPWTWEEDLEGEPLPGRRFRGIIWLLGEVEFLTKVEDKGKEESKQ